MLRAIFYARFHPIRGPSIIHQHPSTIGIVSGSTAPRLLYFSNVSSYIIPPYELCNQSLSICIDGYRILGFPVSLEDNKKYERNRFTFNVCFVLDEVDDARQWERVVAKTAAFFVDLEETSGLLQAEEDFEGLKWAGDEAYPAKDVGIVYALLESIFTQLKAYGETCVQINPLHVLNLRLSKPMAPPPIVKAWEVPLLIRALPHPDEWTWDLSLQQIHPHIDGINHVQRIAELSDVEVGLVCKTIGELVRRERAILLDIFHFQAIYSLTSKFSTFAKDDALLSECTRYVANNSAGTPDTDSQTVLELYRQLIPGLSVKEFYLSFKSQLEKTDVRRFITFGVIKGFLRRVHKYPYSFDGQPESSTDLPILGGSPTKAYMASSVDQDRNGAYKRAAFSSGWATPPAEPAAAAATTKAVSETESTEMSLADAELRKFLDGKHCLDEICVAMHLPEKPLLEKLRSGKFGEVIIFSR